MSRAVVVKGVGKVKRPVVPVVAPRDKREEKKARSKGVDALVPSFMKPYRKLPSEEWMPPTVSRFLPRSERRAKGPPRIFSKKIIHNILNPETV